MPRKTTTTAETGSQPERNVPQIATLLQRLGAAAVDWLLLFAVGQVITLPFTAFWSRFGPYGRFVGIVIVLAYFGTMNSWIGGGQTVGKRLLKIAVLGGDNRPISLWRSLVRTAIFAAPPLLYGWGIPLMQRTEMSWLTGAVVGLGLAIAYTMIVNLEARQGIHDLICGTYVVDPAEALVDEFPESERFHSLVSAAIIVVAALGVAAWNAVPPSAWIAAPTKDAEGLRAMLRDDPRFFSTRVNITIIYVSTLDVEVWYRGVLSEADERALRLDIARMAMENVPRVYQFQYMAVKVRTGYDLGIAAGGATSDEIHWPSVWSRLVGGVPSRPGAYLAAVH